MANDDETNGFSEASASFNHARPSRPIAENPLLPRAIVVCAFAVFALAIAVALQAGYDWFAPTLALIVAARYAVDHFFQT